MTDMHKNSVSEKQHCHFLKKDDFFINKKPGILCEYPSCNYMKREYGQIAGIIKSSVPVIPAYRILSRFYSLSC